MEHKTYICDQHLTSPRLKEKLRLTTAQARMGLAIDDRVKTVEDYQKSFNKSEPDFGCILEFNDHWSHAENSTAMVRLGCGCKVILNVAWLEKD